MTWKYKIIFIFVMIFINMVSPLCFNTVSDYSIYLMTLRQAKELQLLLHSDTDVWSAILSISVSF